MARIAVSGKVHDLIYAIDLIAIVNDEIPRTVSREDIDPEFDVRLDSVGGRERKLGTSEGAGTGAEISSAQINPPAKTRLAILVSLESPSGTFPSPNSCNSG